MEIKEEFKIEKNIPFPKKRMYGMKTKYPFNKMEIGDSFAINPLGRTNVSIRASLYASYRNFKKTHNKPKWDFIIRVLNNEIRIWRIK